TPYHFLYEASDFLQGCEVRRRTQRANSCELFHHRDTNFQTPRNLPTPSFPRPVVGTPGTDSRRYVPTRSLVRLGLARSEDCGQYARPPDRNVDLCKLHDGSVRLRIPIRSVSLRLWLRLWLRFRIYQRRFCGRSSSSSWRPVFRVLW